ncbi:hypothetical protein ACE01N_02615 [Saccharicrinis sp. FJH2]|uniref:hypothetical protein n=1 Tax=Saccharicrinis sp. FJH65 TaxID=3344659 RepID=UPI0035F392D0
MQDYYNSKINYFFDHLFIFVLVIYTGSATTFVRSLNSWGNLIAFGIPILFATIIFIKKNLSLNTKILYIIIGFTLYFIASTLKFREIHPRFFSNTIISFLLTFIMLKSFGKTYFFIYENIITFLTVISLFFWILLQIDPMYLASTLKKISFSEPGSDNVLYNIIIYTVNDLNVMQNYVIHIGKLSLIRNAGFAWEPGAYAVLIDLAIYINLIRTKFNFKHNFKLLILIFGLFSTLSTTGHSILLLLILFSLYNKHTKYLIAFSPALIIITLLLFNLPFMKQKIVSLTEYNTEELVLKSAQFGYKYDPQRFESFLIDWKDFINNPVIGYGGHTDAQWTKKMGANIGSISGIGKIFARYGIVGVFFFFYSLIMSSKMHSELFNFKGWLFPTLMILMISISYSLIEHPVFMCFWLSIYFLNTEQNSNIYTKKDFK